MPVIGVREFSGKVSKYIDEVERSGKPVIITRHGRPAVAMLRVDVDRLQALTVAAAPRLIQDLEQANADLAAGRSRSLDDMLAELDEEEAAAKQVEPSSMEPPAEVEIGEQYLGKVVKTTAFGAFIGLAKGTDGLLHISNVSPGERVESVEDVLKKGDEVDVRVVEVDRERGRIGLRLAHDPEVAGKSVEELAES
jgi:prevent-host-death family protein